MPCNDDDDDDWLPPAHPNAHTGVRCTAGQRPTGSEVCGWPSHGPSVCICPPCAGDSRLYLVDASDGSTLRFLKPYRARGGGVAVQGTFMHPATQKYVRRTFRTINGKR